MMLRYGPALAALLYPLGLSALHQSGQQFLHVPDTAGRLGAGLLLGVAVALVYGVPALSLAAILKSGRDVLARRLAHLAFAAPPLFVANRLAWIICGIGVAVSLLVTIAQMLSALPPEADTQRTARYVVPKADSCTATKGD